MLARGNEPWYNARAGLASGAKLVVAQQVTKSCAGNEATHYCLVVNCKGLQSYCITYGDTFSKY